MATSTPLRVDRMEQQDKPWHLLTGSKPRHREEPLRATVCEQLETNWAYPPPRLVRISSPPPTWIPSDSNSESLPARSNPTSTVDPDPPPTPKPRWWRSETSKTLWQTLQVALFCRAT